MTESKSYFSQTTSKCMLTLLNDQVVWLDQLSVNIRSKTKGVVDRGAIVRSIITAAMESDLVLDTVSSEEEIKQLICERLKTNECKTTL